MSTSGLDRATETADSDMLQPSMAAESPITELENLLGPHLFGVELGGPPVELAGRFRLLEIRGRGARGLVVRAWDTNLGRDVALKLFPSPEASMIEETRGEANALALLRHPNIVAVFDLASAPLNLGGRVIECLYLSMEYIKGPHLRAWIANAAPTLNERITAFLAAGEGLVAAHAAGVIHRDVKPANIVIDHQTARVVDFGLARVVPPGSDPTAPRHTQYGVTKGTLEYMAPEARRGRADARSDIFSFAASLWECLAGVPPFDSNAGEWRLGHQADFDGAEAIPPALAQVLRRALSYRPEDRPSTMRELVDSIAAAHLPPRAWLRPVFVASGALVAITLVLAFTWASEPTAPSAPPPSANSPAPSANTPAPSANTPAPSANAPATSSPSDVAVSAAPNIPAPTCEGAALAGPWNLTTRVLWADDSRYIDAQGYYTLQLSVDARCGLLATVTKTGDSGLQRYKNPLVATADLTSNRDAEGILWWTGAFAIVGRAKPHVFTFAAHGRELIGDWTFHEHAEHPSMKGILRAARGAVDQVPSDLAASLCPSRCRILCAGPNALARCLDTCSAAGEQAVATCGPADNGAPIPAGALALLDDLRRGDAAQGAPGDMCREYARLLAGAWTVRSPSGESELDLTAAECDLIGEVTPTGGDPPYAVAGRVTAQGRWFIRRPLNDDAPAWAFTGRALAFGSTSAREPLVATRARAPDLLSPP